MGDEFGCKNLEQNTATGMNTDINFGYSCSCRVGFADGVGLGCHERLALLESSGATKYEHKFRVVEQSMYLC